MDLQGKTALVTDAGYSRGRCAKAEAAWRLDSHHALDQRNENLHQRRGDCLSHQKGWAG